MTTPNWAAWIENYCGTWHLDTDENQKLEIGMLVVKFPNGDLYPGVVHPNTGKILAGGHGFEALESNGKKQLKVFTPVSPSASLPFTPTVEPTEGEIYEEEDETTVE